MKTTQVFCTAPCVKASGTWICPPTAISFFWLEEDYDARFIVLFIISMVIYVRIAYM